MKWLQQEGKAVGRARKGCEVVGMVSGMEGLESDGTGERKGCGVMAAGCRAWNGRVQGAGEPQEGARRKRKGFRVVGGGGGGVKAEERREGVG